MIVSWINWWNFYFF